MMSHSPMASALPSDRLTRGPAGVHRPAHPRSRGAATMEYAGITIAAASLVAVLIALVKSETVRDLLAGVLRTVATTFGVGK